MASSELARTQQGYVEESKRRCAKIRVDPSHHDKFVSVADFQMDRDFQRARVSPEVKEEVAKSIKEAATAVAKITVNRTSKDRPADTQPVLNMVGTGFLLHAGLIVDDERKAYPRVMTAKHIVFNEEEVVECVVSFDGETEYKGKRISVTSRGNIGDDNCKDFSIIELDDGPFHYNLSKKIIIEEGAELQVAGESIIKPILTCVSPFIQTLSNPLYFSECQLIIVSHPHGGEKMISFGNLCGGDPADILTSWNPDLGKEIAIDHDVPTCTGCSGAPVLMFARTRLRERGDWITFSKCYAAFLHFRDGEAKSFQSIVAEVST